MCGAGQTGGGEGLRLYECWCALELEMSLQLQRETVDLEKCGLADRLLQCLRPIEMVRVIPIDLAKLQVGPILDAAFGQP